MANTAYSVSGVSRQAMKLTDEETADQIRENPYQQYLSAYRSTVPDSSSSFAHGSLSFADQCENDDHVNRVNLLFDEP
jgi:hypothetical protein